MAKPVGILSLLDDESRLPKVESFFRLLISIDSHRQLIKPSSKNSTIISVRINMNVTRLIVTINPPSQFITMLAKSPTVHWDFSRKIVIPYRTVWWICLNIVKMI